MAQSAGDPGEPIQSMDSGHDEEPEDSEDFDNFEDQADICNFCFMSPCCTPYEHDFVGGGQAPCNDNASVRRNRYRKFWQVICNLGGWNMLIGCYLCYQACGVHFDDP